MATTLSLRRVKLDGNEGSSNDAHGHVDLLEGRSAQELHTISDSIQDAMVSALDVPERDRFQIITQHPPEALRFDPHYLDIDRDEGFMLVRVTLARGRSANVKRASYRLLGRLGST